MLEFPDKHSLYGRCIVCHSTDLAPVVDIPDVPVLCCVVRSTRKEAVAVPRADMAISVCRSCGHLFNTAFDPTCMRYDTDYENSLHGSARFRGYAAALADRLIADHDLRGKEIVEIGCGDGRFLELFCGRGGNRGVGYDPGASPLRRSANGVELEVIADTYDRASNRYKGDIVVCRHVLEHVANPRGFVDSLISAMKGSSARLYVEVPNGLQTLARGLIWDLMYEHCSYFSESSLACLLQDRGLALRRLTLDYGDQFLCADAAPPLGDEHRIVQLVPESLWYVESFTAHFHETIENWQSRLVEAAGEGITIVAWGAGSRGVTFLNLIDRYVGVVRHIVDVNPKKWGKFVAGTGQQIVCPDMLRQIRPDLVLLMNPIYIDEVQEQLGEHGLAPRIEIVEQDSRSLRSQAVADGVL